MKRGVCPNKNEHRQGEEEEDDVDEEIELSLGLSMNGRFGVDPMRNKKLKHSSSIAYLAPKAGGCVEIRADRRVLGLVSACHAPALARTQSLPVETEEEWHRQKGLQSMRRMEARKKMMRTGSSGSSDLIDGLICDRGLTLGHLLGGLHDFFSRLGMSKLKFKPAYNPYTEPNMEIFSYHEGLQKWVEVGNSGMFRPEMLLPMGLPEDVQVIAWGRSLVAELKARKWEMAWIVNNAIIMIV